jgi:hypothetical protein
VLHRKKPSTTIGATNHAYLQKDNRATLERQTAAYCKGLSSQAAGEETALENALSAASQEIDFDQP